jgi:hypothetical protein
LYFCPRSASDCDPPTYASSEPGITDLGFCACLICSHGFSLSFCPDLNLPNFDLLCSWDYGYALPHLLAL